VAVHTLKIEGGELADARPDAKGVRGFKGIPYAAAPVGALRWRRPQPVTPWAGIRSVDKYGANSLQGVVFGDIDPTVAGVSEDCLFLNVWTPAPPGAPDRVAVMFWIHGGGFVVGSGAEPRYDGANLAAKGIVVVTVNHRLNALGFLAHPDLSAEAEPRASGAFGMLDLVAALKWVARNIEAFGGDPTRVTIAGESAGSAAVSALMASPLAKSLFARAIGESGGFFATPRHPVSTLAEAEEKGRSFARALGANTVAALRALPAEAILAAAPGLGYRPIVDGYFLPKSPARIFAEGSQNDVPLLVGWTKDEGFNFDLSAGEGAGRRYEDVVSEIFGDRAADALALYPASDAKDSTRALGGDLIIVHPTWAWIEGQKRTGRSEIFRYRFDWAPSTPEGWFGARSGQGAGAFHACEIVYVFDNLWAAPWSYTPEDHEIAALVSAYWVNFIKTGDPNGGGLPEWPSYRSHPLTMIIDTPPGTRAEEGRERHEFVASATGRD
jgi:para-nitrobenzyl esterase